MTTVSARHLDYPYPGTSGDLTDEHLSMPAADLAAIARHPLTVHPDTTELYYRLAREMADELRANNMRGEPTRWILPVGPKAQYPILARICNEERISWAGVFAFHMDEFLDWQGRPVDPSHPFSFRGYCDRNLYQLLEPDLRPHPGNVIYPEVFDPDAYGERLRQVGGADTCFAGFGFR